MKPRFLLAQIFFVSVFFVFLSGTLWSADTSYQGPLFDSHVHIRPINQGRSADPAGFGNRSTGQVGSPFRRPEFNTQGQNPSFLRLGRGQSSTIVEKYKRAGLSGMYLFGPGEMVLKERDRYPDFVFPFTNVLMDPQAKKLKLDEESLQFVENQLDTQGVCGIGEMSMRHDPFKMLPEGGNDPVDGPIALKIYDLAAKYSVPVNIHCEHEFSDELERALDHNPKTIIIWAHCGDAPADKVWRMMKKHSNLYADLSCRNPYLRKKITKELPITDENGIIKSEWKMLLEEFPDRFLFGLDIWEPERIRFLDQLVKYYRSVLGQLKPQTAEKIAYQNARRLIHLDEASASTEHGPDAHK